MSALSRSEFLTAAAAAALPATTYGVRSSFAASDGAETVRALVLSGGTAHGAYEAGVLWALWNSRALNQRGGKPEIPSFTEREPFDFIVGTSIGALNGALFCRDDGPKKLADLWNTIGSRPVLVLRPDYDTAVHAQHGIINRASAVYRIGRDALGSNLSSLCEGEPIRQILRECFLTEDKRGLRPFRIPLIWTATDLTNACAGYFYRLPASDAKSPWYNDVSLAALRSRLDEQNLRSNYESDVDHFVESLRASSAIPAVFEPALLKDSANPAFWHVLSDGGVVNNTPFALAMRAAPFLTAHDIRLEIYAVVLGSRFKGAPQREAYNLLGTLLTSYNIMTQRLFDDAARRATDATTQRTTTLAMTPSSKQKMLSTFVEQTLGPTAPALKAVPKEVEVYVIQPSTDLVGTSFAFTDQDALSWNYELGFRDAQESGFTQYPQPAEFCFLG